MNNDQQTNAVCSETYGFMKTHLYGSNTYDELLDDLKRIKAAYEIECAAPAKLKKAEVLRGLAKVVEEVDNDLWDQMHVELDEVWSCTELECPKQDTLYEYHNILPELLDRAASKLEGDGIQVGPGNEPEINLCVILLCAIYQQRTQNKISFSETGVTVKLIQTFLEKELGKFYSESQIKGVMERHVPLYHPLLDLRSPVLSKQEWDALGIKIEGETVKGKGATVGNKFCMVGADYSAVFLDQILERDDFGDFMKAILPRVGYVYADRLRTKEFLETRKLPDLSPEDYLIHKIA